MYSKSIIFKQTSVPKLTWLRVHYYSSLQLFLAGQWETYHLSNALSCKLVSHDRKPQLNVSDPTCSFLWLFPWAQLFFYMHVLIITQLKVRERNTLYPQSFLSAQVFLRLYLALYDRAERTPTLNSKSVQLRVDDWFCLEFLFVQHSL